MKPEDDVLFSFSPKSPFYRMVNCFITATAGSHSMYCEDDKVGYKESDTIRLEGRITQDVSIRPYDIRKLISEGYSSKDDFQGSLCMMLINTAYELVKDRNDNSPEFEFFRHIRNASSHLNRFFFFEKEPKRLAVWRGIEIPNNPKGRSNPYHGEYCFGNILGMSEALYLLHDIDNKLLLSIYSNG